jgi:hypothetical protein
MAVNLVSPGVNIREVDLTLGRIDSRVQNVGAIAGPFEKGPVNDPVLIETESQLLEVFGKPKIQDDQYEYWMSASNYLSYGGVLRVIRCDNSLDTDTVINANAARVGIGSTLGGLTNLKIYSNDDYQNNHINDTGWIFSSRNPGTWANGLKVCIIDNLADQKISGINTLGTQITVVDVSETRSNVTIGVNTDRVVGVDTTGITVGMYIDKTDNLNIIDSISEITGITTEGGGTIIFGAPSVNSTVAISTVRFGTLGVGFQSLPIQVGFAVTQTLSKTAAIGSSVVTIDGYLRGVVTEVNTGEISVKITDRVDNSGISYPVTYANPGDAAISLNAFSFDSARQQSFFVTSNTVGGITTTIEYEQTQQSFSVIDWYDTQVIQLENNNIFWRSIAPKPGTSQYALERNSKNDEVHVVVIDDTGRLTGTSGNILEKYLFLSKASDGRISPSQQIYYKDYIYQNSNYIYAGYPENGIPADIIVSGAGSTTFQPATAFWGNPAQGSKFSCVGPRVYNLTSGVDYSDSGYSVPNSEVINSYNIFNSDLEYNINFLINGPSGGPTIFDAQAKANALIAIAENRKDCIALISPYKDGIINSANSTAQTNSIIEFFSPLTSSSYAVFDSGYKYTLDRFNNKFVYVPCNSDIAGLISRTSTNNFPWFSPAGSSRGTLNNVIKLAYSPSKAQRDQLYTKRVNPIISSPGAGFILFGDKTALSYASAFDRINVRMLFLTIEKTIEVAARAQLFEFNDAITRANFINIVEPYLRDVRAKRGITEFLIVCDESNNTPDVIDANQFKADIFVKPARSINFIGLTFVATRTGVSFSEVVGTV